MCFMLLVAAVLSLLYFCYGGLDKTVSLTDRENKVYEDFVRHYFPAAVLIYRQPDPVGGYFYSPTFALLLRYFVVNMPIDAIKIWHFFQGFSILLLLIVPTFYLARLTPFAVYPCLYAVGLLVSFPLFHNLNWGQVSLIITFLIIFAFLLYEKGYVRISAMALALATTIKYYPAFFLLGFVLRKDGKFLAWFSGFALAFMLLIPAGFLGLAATVHFYTFAFSEATSALDWVANDVNSQFFSHVILRLASADHSYNGIVSLFGLLICFLVVILLFFCLRHEPDKKTQMLGFTSVFMLQPYLINTSWPHYFVYLPFCAVLAINYSRQNKVAALSLIALFLQTMFCFSLFSGAKQYVFYGTLHFANLLVLIHYALLLHNSLKQTPPDADL